MLKTKERAMTRHNAERVKNNRKNDFNVPFDHSARDLGIHATTPARCSCGMCGNPRHHSSDKLTIQEKRFLDISREYLFGANDDNFQPIRGESFQQTVSF